MKAINTYMKYRVKLYEYIIFSIAFALGFCASTFSELDLMSRIFVALVLMIATYPLTFFALNIVLGFFDKVIRERLRTRTSL